MWKSYLIAFLFEGFLLFILAIQTQQIDFQVPSSPILIYETSFQAHPKSHKTLSAHKPRMLVSVPPMVSQATLPLTQTALSSTVNETLSLETQQNPAIAYAQDDSASMEKFSEGVSEEDSAVVLPQEPVRLYGSEPRFPSLAREQEIEGVVKVKILVDRHGVVQSVQLIEGNDKWGFFTAVKTAVHSWKFETFRMNGIPKAFYIVKTFRFELI